MKKALILILVLVILALLPLLLILLIAFIIGGSNQNKMNNLQNKPVCEYRVMEFEDDYLNEMLDSARNGLSDPYYATAAVQIAEFESLDIDDVIDQLNELIDTAESCGIDDAGTMVLQAYKFGADYIEWLNNENLKHTLSTAKQYQQLFIDSEDKEYTFYKQVLMQFDDDCHIVEGDFAVPIESPFVITGDFMSDAYQSAIGNVHYGIDLSNEYGSDLYAFADAEVVSVYKNCPPDGGRLGNTCGTVLGSGYGNGNNVVLKVNIDGTDYYAIYAHCKNVYVRIGDHVPAGEIIASQGNSGNSTGSHCHFEIRINDINFGDSNVRNLVNPHDLIDFSEVMV